MNTLIQTQGNRKIHPDFLSCSDQFLAATNFPTLMTLIDISAYWTSASANMSMV